MIDNATQNLIKECQRQFDNCLYTSAAMFAWANIARLYRGIFLVAPIILGGIASSQLLLSAGESAKIIGAFCALLAGFFPAIAKALNLELHVEGIRQSATEFTNLRDRFRRAATVTSFASFDEFKAEFEALMDRMDAARANAPPVPDKYFRKAQEKIKSGDYSFDVDKDSVILPDSTWLGRT